MWTLAGRHQGGCKRVAVDGPGDLHRSAGAEQLDRTRDRDESGVGTIFFDRCAEGVVKWLWLCRHRSRLPAVDIDAAEIDGASACRNTCANAAGSAINPPWSPGNVSGEDPSRSASATEVGYVVKPPDSAPIPTTTRAGSAVNRGM